MELRNQSASALSFTIMLAMAAMAANPAAAKPRMSDAQVAQAIIEESIASYPGNCPCPFNSARNGSRCGKRSAYSRPGGYSPICYASDVDKDQIRQYRLRNGQ